MDINKVFQDRIPEWEDGFLVAENRDVAIVGIGYGARKNVVGKLQIGDVLHLERDAANQFDSNAIIAYTNERQEVGFVSADWACIYAAKMDAGMVFDATITAIEKKKIVVTLKRKNLNDTILYDVFRES